MKKRHLVFACIAFNCSAMASDKVAEITPENYMDYVSYNDTKSFKNPFEDSEVKLSYKSKDNPVLTAADFNDSEQIEEYYKQFMNDDLTSVKMLYNPEDSKLYSFFKFNLTGNEIKSLRKESKRSSLRKSIDEFLFLHELFHLDSKTTRSDLKINQKESISDVAAVIMMGAKYDMSPKKLEKLMSGVLKVRRKISTSKNISGKDFQGDMDHFDKKVLTSAVSFFEYLNDNDIKLEATSFSKVLEMAKVITLDSNLSEKDKMEIIAQKMDDQSDMYASTP